MLLSPIPPPFLWNIVCSAYTAVERQMAGAVLENVFNQGNERLLKQLLVCLQHVGLWSHYTPHLHNRSVDTYNGHTRSWTVS